MMLSDAELPRLSRPGGKRHLAYNALRPNRTHEHKRPGLVASGDVHPPPYWAPIEGRRAWPTRDSAPSTGASEPLARSGGADAESLGATCTGIMIPSSDC
eukprot:scaffold3804_cov381-Prasinococcus_capsulatus_cf.AAC.2